MFRVRNYYVLKQENLLLDFCEIFFFENLKQRGV